MPKPILSWGIIIAIVALLAVWFLWSGARTPQAQVACTMEAKICPDGSAVGRTGPNCEFSACPDIQPSTPGTPSGGTVHLGEELRVGNLILTPLSIIEDSRCPLDVQCIQAGRVRISLRVASGLGTSTSTLTLGESITTEAEKITLTEVGPAPVSTRPIPPSSYIFTFGVEPK